MDVPSQPFFDITVMITPVNKKTGKGGTKSSYGAPKELHLVNLCEIPINRSTETIAKYFVVEKINNP